MKGTSEITIKNQRFGMENEMTGITRKRAADVLAAFFDTQPAYIGGIYGEWQVEDGDGRTWALRYDGSIRTEYPNNTGRRASPSEYAVELVTPVLTYEDMDCLQEAIRTLKQAGAKVNDSCGLHVHIDGANHNRQSLKNLLSIMYSKEDMLFKALQVNENREERWCKKVREPMLQKARRLSAEETKDLTRLEDIWYEGFDACNYREDHYNNSRYYALNLHSLFTGGTVEFRCFNATLHAGRAKAYLNLCLAMSAKAIQQRSAVMRKTHSDNELFTFRVWLVGLGLNGEEFKTTREHLLANLEGDRAWRYDRDSYEVNRKKKKTKSRER